MKIILIILGSISLSLGVIGIFVPLLPTTPLLLVASWCFFKSSDKLYRKLIESKYLGTYIRNFKENRIIPIKTKIYIITLLWISLIYCIFFVAEEMLWLQIILAIILIGVTIHILSYKSWNPKIPAPVPVPVLVSVQSFIENFLSLSSSMFSGMVSEMFLAMTFNSFSFT